jgi:hypothetical protein
MQKREQLVSRGAMLMCPVFYEGCLVIKAERHGHSGKILFEAKRGDSRKSSDLQALH